jgi:hypothetical protein
MALDALQIAELLDRLVCYCDAGDLLPDDVREQARQAYIELTTGPTPDELAMLAKLGMKVQRRLEKTAAKYN